MVRTTLDLPDDLLRQAKILAVQRGSTLRDLVASGLRREMALPASAEPARKPLPAIHLSADAPVLCMTPADITRALNDELAADDAARAG